jgi:hypothetical protein
MLGQVRFISRQKCIIRVRRLLCSEDTSKVSSETLSAAVIFASGIVVCNRLYVLKDYYSNYSVHKAVIEDTGPLTMKTIAGDLTTKLCEKSASVTQVNNVGDSYVTM